MSAARARGDAAALRFEDIVLEEQAAVRRICRALLGDDALAADAAQDAFLRLWRRLRAGRPPEVARPWLRRAALSAALDLRRRRKGVAPADLPADAIPDRSPGPPERLARDELRRRYAAALGMLPSAQRLVFVLRHEADVPLAEVASLLGIALPTAKTHFARACLALQAKLGRTHRGDLP